MPQTSGGIWGVGRWNYKTIRPLITDRDMDTNTDTDTASAAEIQCKNT